jgi:hypothetical protein
MVMGLAPCASGAKSGYKDFFMSIAAAVCSQTVLRISRLGGPLAHALIFSNIPAR